MKATDKTKILLTIPEDLKVELVKEADAVNRSLNNYILTVLLKREK
ncbi:MAG: DNA-binding protein [Youngiibacter sp.]|jgi:predicted HicB family RNase H-like nuclease|nr:DNA-binding protein [Youngiibacter sp.]